MAHLAVDKTLVWEGDASALDKIAGRALSSWKSHELLLIHVVRKSAEKLLEPADGWNVGANTQARTYTDPFDWLQIVHFVRNILAVIEIIYWLAMWVPVCHWRKVLERGNSLLWGEIVITDATTERRIYRAHAESVCPHSRGGRGKIGILSRQLVGRGGYSGCRNRNGIRITESLACKHKTDNCC
jgi:hypothetical protein